MTDEQIVNELGYDEATDEIKREAVDGVRGIVESRVVEVVTQLMKDEQSDEFQQLVDAGNDDAVWAWLRSNVVGVDVSEVYEAALRDYLDNFKARQDKLEAELGLAP